MVSMHPCPSSFNVLDNLGHTQITYFSDIHKVSPFRYDQHEIATWKRLEYALNLAAPVEEQWPVTNRTQLK